MRVMEAGRLERALDAEVPVRAVVLEEPEHGSVALGPARDFSVRGNQKFGLLDMLIEEGARRGRRYTPDPRPETGGFFRSDHFTLAKAGVPALSLTPGQDLVNGGVARPEGTGGPMYVLSAGAPVPLPLLRQVQHPLQHRQDGGPPALAPLYDVAGPGVVGFHGHAQRARAL